MSNKANLILRGCVLLLAVAPALAQNFSSGSTGSDGALNVTTDTTLDVPAGGIFNFTTINVAANKNLRFKRNAANSPVYLLASGNVTIAGNISVDGGQGGSVTGGIGGPGGFDGGSPGSIGVPPGAGYGPGAGRPGTQTITADGAGGGAFGTVGTTGSSQNKGSIYGNALLIPMVGGSGGGGSSGTPGSGGGGGGGALLVSSSTRIDHTGSLYARGAVYQGGAYSSGSGGAIRLVAPLIAGNGGISVDAGTGAGLGRIRVDAIDRSAMNFNFTAASVTSVGSLMLVFPTPLPRLDITEAAGTVIPDNSGPVQVQLPFGSTPNRTIKVRARDFNSKVPITLVLTPDHGASVTYTGMIDNTGANNPAVASFDVVLPINEQTTVNVYSK